MKRYYKDFYGGTASIETYKDGTARLRVSAGTIRIKNQKYKSEKGARTALGRFGDSFYEVK